MGKFEDLTGNQYGRLTVLEIDGLKTKEKKRIHWRCECSCGNFTSTTTYDLKSGKAQSCGCKQREKLRRVKKKYNNYDMTGEYGVGYITNTNEPFYFDKEDYDLIKDYAWRKTAHGYVESRNGDDFIFLHRLIMPCDKNHVVDHINHNRLDNRKENLRICTQQENIWNVKRTPGKNSKCVGVSLTPTGKWVARIKDHKKQINLGCFDNYEDAVKARKEAEIKYFGDYRYKGDE